MSKRPIIYNLEEVHIGGYEQWSVKEAENQRKEAEDKRTVLRLRGDEMGASKRNITIYSDYSEMGKKIKKSLVEKNMTATELADALGTSPQYLNFILHGQRSGKKYIKKIEEILGINIVA